MKVPRGLIHLLGRLGLRLFRFHYFEIEIEEAASRPDPQHPEAQASDVVVRGASAEDLRSVTAILDDHQRLRLERAVRHQARFVIAWDGDRVAGYYSFNFDRIMVHDTLVARTVPECVSMYYIYISPEYRGRALSSVLMRAVARNYRAEDKTFMAGLIDVHNAASLRALTHFRAVTKRIDVALLPGGRSIVRGRPLGDGSLLRSSRPANGWPGEKR